MVASYLAFEPPEGCLPDEEAVDLNHGLRRVADNLELIARCGDARPR